jgi:REP element-mobilizing transposase RayT
MSNKVKWYGDQYYHVCNRGHNHDLIFFNDENYKLFLKKFSSYLLPYLDVIAYALLPNHFHFLVKIKPIEIVGNVYFDKYPGKKKEIDFYTDLVHKIIGNSFAALFNSYTKRLNFQQKRVGSLFQGACQRKLIDTNAYLQCLIEYIHYNPIKHGLISLPRDYDYNSLDQLSKYRYSSFPALYSDEPTHIRKDIVLDIFDDLEGVTQFHHNYNAEKIENKICDLLFDE